ncbi:MAG: hypothetical protein BWX71_02314 [Deltaproteobacteria bacterium ADurb.Bin072]|nr:MAG: hypothetical protein BWX71_02314 [Deltaproteobacteria bacterium ADurb.Bin072]
MTSPRVCGQHHPLRRMTLEGRRLLRLNITELHDAHGVRDPRGGPDHDGRSILLAYPEGLPGEVLRLLGAGRLEEGDLGEARIVPVVLFILGGKQFGVVCADEHDPSPHQGVRQSHQRVRGHVHADVLHDGQSPGPCVRSAHSHLEGHLLVGCPFGMDIRVLFHDRLEDLGAWRAGVCGSEGDARLPCPPCHRLVAAEDLLHDSSPLPGDIKKGHGVLPMALSVTLPAPRPMGNRPS